MSADAPVQTNRSEPMTRLALLPRSRWTWCCATLLLGLASLIVWTWSRANRQQAQIDSVLQLGGIVDTRQEQPTWLYALIVNTLGEEHSGGPVVVTGISLADTDVTDADLKRIGQLGDLE